MIQVRELRIGSLVNHIERGIESIFGIDFDGKVYTKEFWEDTSFFEPIPLTEELLLKLGFEKDHTKETFQTETHVLGAFEIVYDAMAREFRYERLLLEYVHQLQKHILCFNRRRTSNKRESMKVITFEELTAKYPTNTVVKCLNTGEIVQIRGVKCLVGLGENQKGYAFGGGSKDVVIYLKGQWAEIVGIGVDAHAQHIQNVLNKCSNLGVTPSQLLKMDYPTLLGLPAKS